MSTSIGITAIEKDSGNERRYGLLKKRSIDSKKDNNKSSNTCAGNSFNIKSSNSKKIMK